MPITVIYDSNGTIIATSVPDPDIYGQQLGYVPQEGQSVLEVDPSIITQEMVRGDESPSRLRHLEPVPSRHDDAAARSQVSK